jgi:hypothetical protein
MPKRGIGFTAHEVDVLLRAIERFLPIGPYEWDRVAAEHESHFPDAGRTKESLKRKFTMLYKSFYPKEITKKAEVSEEGGSDDEHLRRHF